MSLKNVIDFDKSVLQQSKRGCESVDGMGYTIRDSTPERCLSYTEYAYKDVGYGRVTRVTKFPSIVSAFFGATSSEIKEEFSVPLCWEEYSEVFENVPPSDLLPKGAIKLINPDICDYSIWFAVFDNVEYAEAFSASLTSEKLPRLVRGSVNSLCYN